LGNFSGKDQPLSEGEKSVLPKDTEIVKKFYSDAAGNVVNAQIVLSGAEKRSIHRPELCLPAQGWSINRREAIPVKLADGRTISVMKNSISRPVEISPGVTRTLNSFYCYWFVGKDISTPSHTTRILLTSWDRVVHRKNHRWAYVAVSAPILEGFKSGGKNDAETQAMISDFIGQLAPVIMKK
jgi:EpsI family protein